MRKLPFYLLSLLTALPIHAGIVLRCDEIRARRTGGAYDPAHSQWSFAYDPNQPLGPLDIVLWLAVAILGFVVIKKHWIRLSALGRAIASRREWIRHFTLSAANLFVRLVIVGIGITLAGAVVVLLYRAGQTSGFFVSLQTQIKVWLAVLPEGLLENVFVGSVLAGLLTLWLATSKHTEFRAGTRLIMIACALAINLADGVLLASSPERAKPQTQSITGTS
jgi:hypothetical protein